MKSILLYASNDAAMESRLQAALDVTRRCDAHLTLTQTLPYQDYLAIDMFGGAHLMADVLAASEAIQTEVKEKMEARLANEAVKWDWQQYDGSTIDMIVDASRFSDLVVFSLGDGEKINRNVQRSILGEVIMDSQRPVLAVPASGNGLGFDRAMVAYDGGGESASAIRAALPMLKQAGTVQLVEVEEKESSFPMTDAAEYLARHGIKSEVMEIKRGRESVAKTLLSHADSFRPDFIVMGAYGRGRLRENLFGGVTRHLLGESKYPLLLSS